MAKQKSKGNPLPQTVRGGPLKLPPGVKLACTLRGHGDWIGRPAWSPDKQMLASPSRDRSIWLWDTTTGVCLGTLDEHMSAVTKVAFGLQGRTLASGSQDWTVNLWDTDSGRLLRKLQGHRGWICDVAFDPTGRILASGSDDKTVNLWEADSGRLLHTLKGHESNVNSIDFDSTGRILASGSDDNTIKLWEVASGRLLRTLRGHLTRIISVNFDPSGRTLVSGSGDHTVNLWEVASGRLLRILEGHTDIVQCVAFLFDGRLLASKSGDNTIRLWGSETGACLGTISEPASTVWLPGLAFHPSRPLLATVGSNPEDLVGQRDRLIHIWELDLAVLLGQAQAATLPTSHYVNAKVVLLGDTGVGKTGLSLVLNGKPFEATDSTPGRRIWTFQSQEVELDNHRKQTRETLLWDLAGQPGYRVIHQLHLNEVAVALIVFDARSESDPLAGVRHWERALRVAQQRRGASSVPMKKLLVSARTDRGTVSVSKERLAAVCEEFEFDGYFETSAKEGWKIKELREAIEQAIPWKLLPEVSSSVLFSHIKAFLLEVKKTGRLVAPASQIYDEFVRARPQLVENEPNLRDQFDTCVGRLENRDLIRRLSFGGYVLLQPELLDAYGSAMVNAAKEEPDGLGSIPEDSALACKFYVPAEQKVKDPSQEQLLLHATVEELVRHDLALRESAADGRHLVFPSQFNRDYEDAPEPRGKALAVTFDGPAQSIYATLVVRLDHSGLVTTARAEMWRNAALFTAPPGGKCGLYLHMFAEGRGRLVIFYGEDQGQAPSDETRFHFEEFVLAHIHRRALADTVDLVRFFVCATCGDPVPDSYVKRLREKNLKTFECPCGGKVSLLQPTEKLHFKSEVEMMDQSAERQRNFEIFVESARGETSTPNFIEWTGGERVTLAIVFTDIVDSTSLGENLKDERMNEVRRLHFAQSRKLIEQFKGREIKTIGDSFMAAFRSVEQALDYAIAFEANPGNAQLHIRAGIHIGSMRVEENDVFGGSVNFAARVVGAFKEAGIWLSDRAKEDVDRGGAKQHRQLRWEKRGGVAMKGFPGTFTIWSLNK